ncbi:MAG: outer membrane lipoprotein-sorting protein, partial [Aliifodinibius sp.]|nr:outer membrane lipoprotein-sorting protein [Fodinibius sp.]
QQVRDRKIPTKWVMHDNIKEKRYTVIEVIDMKYGIDIDERRFSFRELERGG